MVSGQTIDPSREPDAVTAFRLGGAVLVFGLLVWVSAFPMMHRWDEATTAWLQRAAPVADLPAAVLVLLGNAEVVIPAVALSGALWLRRNRESAIATLWLAVGLIGASLLALTLKFLIVHPGPPASFLRHVFDAGLQAPTPYSFPSGHTLRTVVLTGTALREVRWLAGLLVAGMMAALVYLGHHWLSDVLGGLCLGWALIEAGEVIRKARFLSCRRG